MDIVFVTLGYAGAVFYLLAYYLLNRGIWTSASYAYQFMNIAGGVCLVMNTVNDMSFPSALTNFIWILIALYGLYNQHKLKKKVQVSAEMNSDKPGIKLS